MLEHKKNADSISRYDLPSAKRICCNRSRARCRDQNATLPPREWIVNPRQRIGYHVWLDAMTEIRGNPMLDSHIRHLLDTVFKAPPGTAEPDVAALRKAAEEAPKLLGGVPETLASVSDTSAFGETCAVALRVYRAESASAL